MNDDYDKGRQLLVNAYSPKIVAKKKTCFAAVKQLLHNMFHTKDDEFIKEAIKSCRGSSLRLMKYINRDPEMHTLTDNAITNFILLMLVTQNGDIAKKHQVKKQFSLLCSLCDKAVQQQDHNTAFIIDKALNSTQIQCIDFKRPKRFKALQRKIIAQHGNHDKLYYKHVVKLVQAYQSENSDFIPIAPVLDMHSKKATAMQKATRGRNSWHIQARESSRYIQHIIASLKQSLPTKNWTPLIRLYTQEPKTKTTNGLFNISNKIK